MWFAFFLQCYNFSGGKIKLINQLITAFFLMPGFWLGYKFSPLVVDWIQKILTIPFIFHLVKKPSYG